MAISEAVAHRYAFADFEFEIVTGTLKRSGIRLRLEKQPAKVLQILLEARGGLVTRTDLIDSLWPEEIEGDFERRLDKAVAKLRASLCDNHNQPRFIETFKGRGYCFISEIIECIPPQGALSIPGQASNEGEVLGSIEPPELPNASEGRSKQQLLVYKDHPLSRVANFLQVISRNSLYGAVALLLLGLGLMGSWLWAHYRSALQKHPAILVLGFRNSAAPDKQFWISDFLGRIATTDFGYGQDVTMLHWRGGWQSWPPATTKNGCSALSEEILARADRAYNADFVLFGEYTNEADDTSGSGWLLRLCLVPTHGAAEPIAALTRGNEKTLPQLFWEDAQFLRKTLRLKALPKETLSWLLASYPMDNLGRMQANRGASILEQYEAEMSSNEQESDLWQSGSDDPASSGYLLPIWTRAGYLGHVPTLPAALKAQASKLSPTQQLHVQALIQQSQNNWDGVIATSIQIVRSNPYNLEEVLRLTALENLTGNPQQALQQLADLKQRSTAALADPRVALTEANAEDAFADYQAQRDSARNARKLAQGQGANLIESNALMEEGHAEESLGNWQKALLLYQQSEDSYSSIKQNSGALLAEMHISRILLHEGHLDIASAMLAHCMEKSSTPGMEALLFEVNQVLGELELQRNPKRALALAQENIDSIRSIRSAEPQRLVQAYASLAAAQAKLGKHDEALASIKAAFSSAIGHMPDQEKVSLLMARAEIRLSEPALATEDVNQATLLAILHHDDYDAFALRVLQTKLNLIQKSPGASKDLEKLRLEARQRGFGLLLLQMRT